MSGNHSHSHSPQANGIELSIEDIKGLTFDVFMYSRRVAVLEASNRELVALLKQVLEGDVDADEVRTNLFPEIAEQHEHENAQEEKPYPPHTPEGDADPDAKRLDR